MTKPPVIKILQKMSFWKAFLVVLIIFVGAGTTLAYQKTQLDIKPQGDFVLQPGKTQLTLDPGQNTTQSITVTNRIDHTVAFSISLEDIEGSDDPNNAVVLLGDQKGPYSLKSFLTPEIKNFTLKSGEEITVPVTVSVPKGASPGGYYGAVIVSTENASPGGGATIVSRLGSIFLLRVTGTANESGHLSEFKVLGPQQMFYQKGPDGFEVQFTNEGNVHLVPYGVVTVRNIIGQVVGQIPVAAYFALPNSIRYRDVAWQKPAFLFGRYTATVELYPGYGPEATGTQKLSLSFWVLPWSIIVPIFIGIILLAIIFYLLMTRFEIHKKT